MHRFRLVHMCLLVVALAGCGGGTAAALASKEIDDTGGTVSVTTGTLTGAAAVIPAGALANPLPITIDPGANVAAGTGTSNVGPAVRLGPAGTTFSAPVAVTVPFTPSQTGGEAVSVVQRNDSTGAITIHAMPTVSNGLATVTTT
ncbi:MAG: hypothetical protein OER88_14640, partial [Planctomycetota bacterium]|nr:hypothetical protein [Planctomycetota bacterium]